MAFKIEGKEMYPIFVFAMCCWSVHSEVVRLGKHAHSKQKNHSYINSAVSCQVYVHALLVQHQECILPYMIWYGPKSAKV